MFKKEKKRKLLGLSLDDVWAALDGLYSIEDGVELSEPEENGLIYAINVLNRVASDMYAEKRGVRFDR